MATSAKIFDFAAAKYVQDHKAATFVPGGAYFDERPFPAIRDTHEGQDGFWVLTYPANTQVYTLPLSTPEDGEFIHRDAFFARFSDEFFRHLTPAAAARAPITHFNDVGCRLSHLDTVPKIYGALIDHVESIASDGFYTKGTPEALTVKKGQLAVHYKNASLEVMDDRTATSRLHYWEDHPGKFERWPVQLPY